MQKSGITSLWEHIQADNIAAVKSLVSLVLESPFPKETAAFMRSQLAMQMTTAQKPISHKFIPLLSILDSPPASQAEANDMISSATIAIDLAKKLSANLSGSTAEPEADPASVDVSFTD